ncbi:MAG: hypothetical protein AAF662_07020 [Pseudomonadota bacterium]
MTILGHSISPKDIGICIALPFNIESFTRCLEKPAERGDYLRKLVRHQGESIESFFDRAYSPAASVMRQFVSAVEEMGVRIWPDVTLDSLQQATRSHRVIVFAGHWKGFPFSHWDFVDSPSKVLARLEASPDGIVRALYGDMILCEPDLTEAVTRNDSASIPRLSSALNRSMKRLTRQKPISPGTLDEITQSDLNALRERLDENLAGATVPGNRFELADVFIDAYSFADAFPDDREGIADLVACTSTVPAPAFDRERPYIRTISAPHELNPYAWPNLIEATVRILRKHSMPYWNARQTARTVLKEIGDSSK